MKSFGYSVVLLLLSGPSLRVQDQSTIVPVCGPLVHLAEVHGATLSPDGTWAATGASDNKLRLWDTTTGTLHGEPLEHPGGVYPVAFSPDSKTIVAGSDKGAKLWDVASGRLLAEFPHRGFVYALAFRPDGLAVLTGSHDSATDGVAQLWDARTGKPIGEAVRQRFYAVAFSPDGKKAACSGNGNVVQLIDAATGGTLGIELRHIWP